MAPTASQSPGSQASAPSAAWTTASHLVVLLVGMSMPSAWDAAGGDAALAATSSTAASKLQWAKEQFKSKFNRLPIDPEDELPPISDEVYYATGNHLLVDLYKADEAILNDGKYLEESVVGIIRGAGMHMLSVDMHQLEPQGVSVVAAISESHLTIHTWPEHGTALIDLFTCGDGTDLLDILPDMVKRFGGTIENTKWAYVGRGDANAVDVQKHVLGRQHIEKERLTKAESPFQKIEIWKISAQDEYLEDENFNARKKFSRGATARTTIGNYTKVMFLNDAIETSTADEQVYHESLVHPGMAALAHDPRRVAIFGSPAGAVLREVLKYKSVEEVVMVERDGEVIKQAREFLPEMSNCSWEGAEGASFSSCFDSSRATIHTSEVAPWLENYVGGDVCASPTSDEQLVPDEKKFDVIIMDLFDPELIYDSKHSSRGLYTDSFFKQINCALKSDGVLITQLGESPFAVDRHSILNSKLDVLDRLASGFHPSGTFVYNTYVPSFNAEWSFAVACRSRECANQWYSSAADVNRVLRNRLDPRILPTKLGFFDGAVMQTMQQTPKGWENLFCAGANAPAECKWALADGASGSGHSSGSKPTIAAAEAAAAVALLAEASGTAPVVRITRTGLERLDALVSRNNSAPEHRAILDWVLRYGKSCDVAGGHVFVQLDQLLEDEEALQNNAGSGGAGSVGDTGTTRWTPLAQRHLEEYCMGGGTGSSKQDMFQWNITDTTLAAAAKLRRL